MKATTEQGGDGREIHLREYWRVIVTRHWSALAAFAFVVGAVALYSYLKTPIYEATALVEVQPQARRLAPGQDASGIGAAGYGWFAEEKYVNTQVEIVKSRSVAERAFKTLGLDTDPRFSKSGDPVGGFRDMILVNPRRETGLLEVSMKGTDRFEVARWVNVVTDVFVARNLEKAKENVAQALDAITSLMDPLKQRLSNVEAKRFDVLKQTANLNPEGQTEIVHQRLSKLNELLTTTRSELGRLDGVLTKIAEIQANQGDPLSIPELSKDEVLQKLSTEKANLEKEFEGLKVTFRPGAPPYQEKESQLASVKKRIWEQVGVDLDRIRNQYSLARSDERSVLADLKQAEQQGYTAGIATSQYDIARTDAATTKQMYDAIAKTLNEVSVSSQLVSNNISLVDGAIPPLYPVSPNKRLNLVLGTLVGLFVGIGFAFFLDYLDNTFHLPEDIEQHLGLNTVAVVPRFEAGSEESNFVKEAYQTLRTALVFLSKGRERKVVLLTSTAPQEGKSSTTAHLAEALANAGERVLLVDCDLRRPTQHVHLGLTRDGGLTDFLSSNQPFMNWRTYIKNAKVENLQAMTCGPIPPNPPDLLGSERFRRFIAEAREAYDWVLLDSPPAATLADASLLAGLSDMVLVVVRHNLTDRDIVARTVQQLQRVGASIAGVVLNNVDIGRAFGKDYYYAGYYYNRREGEPESGEQKKRRSKGLGAGVKG
jgi:succinoglycan biosynthesis transport protein ExoP